MAIVLGAIDGFTIFRDAVVLRGWAVAKTGSVAALEVRPTQGPARRFNPDWLPSPDVAHHHGNLATRCRFDMIMQFGSHANKLCGGSLWAILSNGAGEAEIGILGTGAPSPAGALFEDFLEAVRALPDPKVLEIGSRARSGVTRKQRLPKNARYVGCDIIDGPNVDRICDAHALSSALRGEQFDAVMAFSVLEHLVMPWKVIIELNRVLALGAIGIFTTHQCWPIHDAPWDFWRFSDRAWIGLLNAATGFEIISAKMSEPAYVVPEHCHSVTNFAPEPAGFLASNVLFRKIGPTTLEWPVEPSAILNDVYPT